jgi:hypothetical protein
VKENNLGSTYAVQHIVDAEANQVSLRKCIAQKALLAAFLNVA